MLREKWLSWLPWRYIVRRVARAHGFIDPIALLASLHRFAQPSEVAEPIELLRAGIVFHARGLMNTKAIQHNMDWVWPHWVERQFDPHDDAFIPRAFSITHVNLTHRNWTGVGQPGHVPTPVVDPRGLIMPRWDSWSVDAWIVKEDGEHMLPSRHGEVDQSLQFGEDLHLSTRATYMGFSIESRVDMVYEKQNLECRIEYTALSSEDAWLAVSLRPYNPEGVSFINSITVDRQNNTWLINEKDRLTFDTEADEIMLSDYATDDVFSTLRANKRITLTNEHSIECRVGMATGASLFKLQAGKERKVTVQTPLCANNSRITDTQERFNLSWKQAFENVTQIKTPDQKFNYLFNTSIYTLILLSPSDAYPGPFTYKRFWFRDAVFIMHSLLVLGLKEKVEKMLDSFPERQTSQGYFLSQEGEWDSNGQVLWMYRQYSLLANEPVKAKWLNSIKKGAEWIINKREDRNSSALHEGLLPAGFSAEHLGLNDYYYWDDFWAVAGLKCASKIFEESEEQSLALRYLSEAESLSQAIENSLERAGSRRSLSGIPASPYRRMDSGAIGSIIAGYPLKLWEAKDSRLLGTLNFLMDNCFVKGAFFQDMIHSGINPYLSLHIAQILLRADDSRYFDIFSVVADMASPTGQWPEAIHPRTGGGCMGDGHHSWASAEWILMQRNSFVREEDSALILASGLPLKWTDSGETMSLGPTLTSFGSISVTVCAGESGAQVSWNASWYGKVPSIEIRLPGYAWLKVQDGASSARVKRLETNRNT